jgi:hypothetical protein
MKLLNNLKSLIVEIASIDDIQRSIDNRNLVTIYYDGDEDGGVTGKGYRTLEPICLGYHKNTNNLVLSAWETEGRSYSRDKKGNPIPGWRLFRVDKIFTYTPLSDTFNEVRPKFNSNGDKRMSRIIKIIKHGEIKRGEASPTSPIVEDYQPINTNYNIPQEFISDKKVGSFDPSTSLDQNRILNSKLPDEIKRLMIEQPIVQSNTMSGGSYLSNEVIEGAQRLMKKEKISESPQTQKPKQNISESQNNSNINLSEIKNIIRDVVRDTVRDVVKEQLKESGLVVESSTDTNEVIQFKVGDTLFVGRITKVKKITK